MAQSNQKIVELILHIFGMVIGIFVIAGGVYRIMYSYTNFVNVVIAIYLMIFGLILFLIEIMVHPIIYSLFGFLSMMIGRGFFYLFCGTLLYVANDWTLLWPITTVVCGVIWIALHFIGISPPPPFLSNSSHQPISSNKV